MENNQEIKWGSHEENQPPQDNNKNWDMWDNDADTQQSIPQDTPDNTIVWDTLENDQDFTSEPLEELEENNTSLSIDNLINLDLKASYLGNFNKVEIKNSLYQLNIDNIQALNDLQNSSLKELDDYRFDFSPSPNTALGNIISNIFNIAKQSNSRITSCNVYQVPPGSSVLNLYKNKPKTRFIYFIQADYNSGDVILDFSSLGGPSIKAQDSTTGILSLIPGWVPYRITPNQSELPLIFISGTLD